MLKDVGASSRSSVFIPHSPGALNDISQQIRQGMMEAHTQGGPVYAAEPEPEPEPQPRRP